MRAVEVVEHHVDVVLGRSMSLVEYVTGQELALSGQRILPVLQI